MRNVPHPGPARNRPGGDPVEKLIESLRSIGKQPVAKGESWLSCCPAHEDSTPSLSIGRGNDGRALVKCFAGCSAKNIVAAVGLTMADLMPAPQGQHKRGGFNIVAEYDYRDEGGRLLYQVVRLEPKSFRPRRPEPSERSGWSWNLGNVRRVPYRLPDLIAAPSDALVFVPEGEKDCDGLHRVDIVATTNAGGAGNWHTLDKGTVAKVFRGRDVVVLPDNDEPGAKHAKQVAAALHGIAARVRIVPLPGLSPKGDVSDWLASGGTAAELLKIVNATPTFSEATKTHEANASQTAVSIIADYFRERYRPVFRDGAGVGCADGSHVSIGVAVSVPNSVLISRLANATDAPRNKNGDIENDKLPNLFNKWARTAWGDLLDSLPEETAAKIGGDSATAETFRQMVREAMLSEIVLGDIIGRGGATQTERRSLIDWCERFAKRGPWKSIRSKKCWCKHTTTEEGELVLQVAIRHELFGQLKADRRIINMGPTKFKSLASSYGVGKVDEDNRPHGQRAIVLNADFVRDLTSGLASEEDAENLPEASSETEPASDAETDRQKMTGSIDALKH